MRNSIYITAITIIFLCSCAVNDKMVLSNELSKTTQMPLSDIDQKVEALLVQMTLEEKVGQMNQYNGFWDFTGPAPVDGDASQKYKNLTTGKVGSMLNVTGVKNVREVQELVLEGSRLKIPAIFGFDAIHGYQTQSPIPLAEAASWDMEAVEKSARISAIESAAAGLNWTFAPMVDVGRDARWGRVMEGAGEDPYLGSKVAAARVKGFQGEDLSDDNSIAACAKHFAAYGFAEAGRDYNTSDIGTSTLYNMVLPPFKAAKDAGIASFMNSFNDLNGVPATGDKFLQRDLLKGEWEFDGLIVSDWGSIGEMIAHGYAKDGKHAAELAVNAGSDMDMESYLYVAHLESLVEEGKVSTEDIDDAVRRILRLKYRVGLFDDPFKYCDEDREKELLGHKDHHDAVLDVAKKSIVLLKNEGQVLPLKKEQKIALIGPLADDKNSPLGSWRLRAIDNSAVSVLEGMQSYLGDDFKSFQGVRLVEGNLPSFPFHVKINETDKTGMEEAIEQAKNAEVVVMVVGEYGYQTGEGRSRAKLTLPGLQRELIAKVYEVNPNMVLVNMSGRPLVLTWADEKIPAIVQAWHLGSQSGHAIAQVLFGDYNPSGKLPMSFPKSLGQVPIYYNHKATGRPNELPNDLVFWSHYSDESNDPLYCFGHGLSYTTFEYSDLEIVQDATSKTVQVKAMIKNTGAFDGEEVIQLYIRDKVGSVIRPVKELKGFHKVMIPKGGTTNVLFELTEKELGFYNNQGKFVVESGDFEVWIGGNSEEGLKGEFTL